jgi:hypothetical protein
MEPNQVFKRRHFGNPIAFSLITTNYLVVVLGLTFTVSHHKIHWFFWVIFGLLALYNAYSLRKNWSEFDKANIIAYIIGAAGLSLLFFLF